MTLLKTNDQEPTIAVDCYGPKTGTPVFLLHGFPDTVRTWTSLISSLQDLNVQLIVVHMRGYTRSGFPSDNDFSLRALAEDVLRVMNELQLSKAVVIGHDWGASTAYALASLAPERFKAMITLAIPPLSVTKYQWWDRLVRPHNVYLRWPSVAFPFMMRQNMKHIDFLYQLWSPRWKNNQSHIAHVKQALKHPDRMKAALAYYRNSLSAEDQQLFSQTPSVPIHVIYGADEPLVRQRMFQQAARQTPYHVYMVDQAGHWPHLEQPRAVEDLIRQLLSTDL